MPFKRTSQRPPEMSLMIVTLGQTKTTSRITAQRASTARMTSMICRLRVFSSVFICESCRFYLLTLPINVIDFVRRFWGGIPVVGSCIRLQDLDRLSVGGIDDADAVKREGHVMQSSGRACLQVA